MSSAVSRIPATDEAAVSNRESKLPNSWVCVQHKSLEVKSWLKAQYCLRTRRRALSSGDFLRSSWDLKKRQRRSLSWLMSSPNLLHPLTQNSGNMGRIASLSWDSYLTSSSVAAERNGFLQGQAPLWLSNLKRLAPTHLHMSNVYMGSVGSTRVYVYIYIHTIKKKRS